MKSSISLSIKKYYFVLLLLGLLASCAPEEKEDIIADYSGSWTCSESTSNPAGTSTFTVRFKKVASSATEYKLENFYNLGFNNEAAASISSSSINLPNQTIGAGNSAFTANGSGTISSSNKLIMTYTMNDGSGVTDNCSATFTKQ